MKWILPATFGACAILVVASGLAIFFWDVTKAYVDTYANFAGILGLFVSIFGFGLTVWTVFETLRVSTKSQRAIQQAINEGRKETKELLDKIRIKMMGDTCEQAYLFASEARHSVRSGLWLRAVEKCHDARLLASRLLTFRDLTDAERTPIRAIVEDLRTTIAFIEKNRLKSGAPPGLPTDKLHPIDSLIDELEKVRSRLQQQLLEVSYVDKTTN